MQIEDEIIKEIIRIIPLASIIIGAALGILGSATITRDKSGKLTKWGIIAITGIVIANSIYFVQTILKQQVEEQNHIQSMKEQTEKLKIETDRFDSTMNKWQENFNKQDKIISKTEASLNTSKEIQKKTDSINQDVQNNLEKQDTIISSTVSLNQKQNEIYKSQIGILDSLRLINKQINRSLNPFKPFAIKFIVRLKPSVENLGLNDTNSTEADKYLKKFVNINEDNFESTSGYYYELKSGEKGSEDFNFLDSVLVYINFIPNEENGRNGADSIFSSEFKFQPLEGETGRVKAKNWNIKYYPNTKEYEIEFYNERILYTGGQQVIKSTLDLPGTELISTIKGLPTKTELVKFIFLFPPNFSKEVEIKDSGKQLHFKHTIESDEI